jgi:NADH-quinone oxidoreductase subunit G
LPRADELGGWLSNAASVALEAPAAAAPNGLERIADVPIYFAVPLVRRAPSLQKTKDALPPTARVHPATLERMGIPDLASVRLRQDGAQAKLPVVADARVPEGCVRVAAGHPATAPLGPMFGRIALEPA